ncbi:kinesin-domain-containing protein [Saitoella complicata NRRL Y-17804]|nr:kinesin-domain-containing protein [Saitoella complicata NRRL Y-17804]ODQ49768.1 kinesin-domain-containing protein [Saitoella complicata NRRL Y-17804]
MHPSTPQTDRLTSDGGAAAQLAPPLPSFSTPFSHRPLSSTSPSLDSQSNNNDKKTVPVQVAIRVRDLLDQDAAHIPTRFLKSCVECHSPTTLSLPSTGPSSSTPAPTSTGGTRKSYTFDHVFPPPTTQSQIYTFLAPGIEAFVQGYNVSILAYGQSGAGKSYTMGTSSESLASEGMGVIPRAAQHLFEVLPRGGGGESRPGTQTGMRTPQPSRLSMPPSTSSPRPGSALSLLSNATNKGEGWELSVSYLEIYNETIHDLLSPSSSSSIAISTSATGVIQVTGLERVPVTSAREILEVLERGSKVRQTGETGQNEKSSRSHAVFTLWLTQRRPRTTTPPPPLTEGGAGPGMVTVVSKINFVDLAGSERLKNTGAVGGRAKEGIAINQGLASLGKVISQLSSVHPTPSVSGGASIGVRHISYRDSKLTRLLQDSLGGTALTYMIACINPAEYHLGETLNTIGYAQRARKVRGRPVVGEIGEEGWGVEELRGEVERLRTSLKGMQLHDAKVKGVEGERRTPESVTSVGLRGQYESLIAEYEETIRKLEDSLSTTRIDLSTTESHLLDRDQKLAYSESLNLTLQQRLAKLMERESATEAYLQDLEEKLEGEVSAGDETSALVQNLRGEMGRLRREGQAAEAYIADLEERLARADADVEGLTAHVERLENEMECDRRDARLDSLLKELDEFNSTGMNGEKLDAAEQIAKLEDDLSVLQSSHETALTDLDDIKRKHEETLREYADINDRLSEALSLNAFAMANPTPAHSAATATTTTTALIASTKDKSGMDIDLKGTAGTSHQPLFSPPTSLSLSQELQLAGESLSTTSDSAHTNIHITTNNLTMEELERILKRKEEGCERLRREMEVVRMREGYSAAEESVVFDAEREGAGAGVERPGPTRADTSVSVYQTAGNTPLGTHLPLSNLPLVDEPSAGTTLRSEELDDTPRTGFSTLNNALISVAKPVRLSREVSTEEFHGDDARRQLYENIIRQLHDQLQEAVQRAAERDELVVKFEGMEREMEMMRGGRVATDGNVSVEGDDSFRTASEGPKSDGTDTTRGQDLRLKIKRLEQELQETHHSWSQTLEQERSEANSHLARLRGQLSSTEIIIKAHLDRISSLEDELQSSHRENEHHKANTLELQSLISSLEDKIMLVQRDREEVGEKLADVANVLEGMQREYAATLLRAEETSAAAEGHRRKVGALEAEVRALRVDRDSNGAYETEASGTKGRYPTGYNPDRRPSASSVNSSPSNGNGRRTTLSLHTPPPSMQFPIPMNQLPPLPASPSPNGTGRASKLRESVVSNASSRIGEYTELEEKLDRQEAEVRRLEDQLRQERKLISALEDSLTETERLVRSLRTDMKKIETEKQLLQSQVGAMQATIDDMREETASYRYSQQEFEQERVNRARAEEAKRALEERMMALSQKRKSKFLGCF